MGVGGQSHAAVALPRERPSTRCIGGWVGPTAALDGCGKSRRHRESMLRYPFFWVITRRLDFICRRFGTLCSIFIGL